MILELKTYIDDQTGACVNAATPLIETQGQEGKPVLLPAIRYSAETQIVINTPNGQQAVPFQFAFPEDYTLPQCFKEFKEVGEAAFKKHIEEMREKQSGLILPPEKQVII